MMHHIPKLLFTRLQDLTIFLLTMHIRLIVISGMTTRKDPIVLCIRHSINRPWRKKIHFHILVMMHEVYITSRPSSFLIFLVSVANVILPADNRETVRQVAELIKDKYHTSDICLLLVMQRPGSICMHSKLNMVMSFIGCYHLWVISKPLTRDIGMQDYQK